MKQHISILGYGASVPERVLNNAELTQLVDTTDEWIVTRTGIRERHILKKGQGISGLAAEAGRLALADAGIGAEEITHVLFATCTPDSVCPSCACTVSAKLGIKHVFALDINAACSGFIYGLSLAQGLLCANAGAKILVIGGDALSSRVNWEDRSTCILFGDGAGAVVLASGDDGAVLKDVLVSSDGSLSSLLHIDGGGSAHPYELGEPIGPEFFIRMEGRELYKHAVRNMTAACSEVLQRNGLTVEDVDLFIPHQANLRIIDAVGNKLNINPEKVFSNVQWRGNTSAASVPLALVEAKEAGRLQPGMKVLLGTFGGGLTWGACLFRT